MLIGLSSLIPQMILRSIFTGKTKIIFIYSITRPSSILTLIVAQPAVISFLKLSNNNNKKFADLSIFSRGFKKNFFKKILNLHKPSHKKFGSDRFSLFTFIGYKH